jgi:hypothetical protein
MPGTIFFRVTQSSGLVHLQPTEDREIKVTATDEAERHSAVERAGARQGRDRTAARVGQGRMRHALLGRHAHPDQPVFGLEKDVNAVRYMVRDKGRYPDAKIHQHSGFQLAGDPTGDGGLRFQSGAYALETR